jgi:hypothetical protein
MPAAILLALGALLHAQQPRVVLDEHFDALNPAVWTGATNGLWQVGEPQSWQITQLDGRGVLLMESAMRAPERRGFLSLGTFPMRRAHIEVEFCALSGDGIPLEAWVLFPYGDALIAFGAHADGRARSVHLRTPGALYLSGAVPWQHGRWYRYTVDASATRVRFALHDGPEVIWSAEHHWQLCYIAPEWGVGLLQYCDEGGGSFRAAVDRVQVTVGCGADLDDDGVLTVGDFVAFVNRWTARSCAADMSDDRQLNITDLMLFHNAFAAGCL